MRSTRRFSPLARRSPLHLAGRRLIGRRLIGRRLVLFAVALALLAASPLPTPGRAGAQPAADLAATPDQVALWPEEQRSFFQDGPGLLLDRQQRQRLAGLDEAGRQRLIEELLADPIPETPDNELTEGIRRRTVLARASFLSPTDVRYQLLFLDGRPAQRLQLDCGQTFKPTELWTYPPDSLAGRRGLAELVARQRARGEEPDALGRVTRSDFQGWQEEGPRLVLYRPAPGAPFRLWEPLDAKRALYTSEMEYYLEQFEELRHLIRGRRFDLQACEETEQVELATGVEALTGYIEGRPSRDAIYSFLQAPGDLAAWAREAAATPLPPEAEAPVIPTSELEQFFPKKHGQRMAVRLQATVDTAALELDDDGRLQLAVEVVLESDGDLFGESRTRYTGEPPPGGRLPLAVDLALRPDRRFVARFKITDQLGDAQGFVSGGFEVPAEPVAVDSAAAYEEAVVLGEELAQQAAQDSAIDSLLLTPPIEGEVTLGLWRAAALITGQRIEQVTFFVDGEKQLTRNQPPFSAEVRLDTYPREQVVRAEGYDADGELVAADEVVLNQPRGAFRVSIVEPRRGVRVSGEITARAEVVVPEDRTVERVEFRLDDELIETLERPPWITRLTVPEFAELTYVSATAVLDDGRAAEDVRFLNAPKYLEQVDVRLIELYTTVTDRSGRMVRGLTVDDFEVREDGRAQEIVKFELVENLPLTIGITIDTSGSMRSALTQAQEAGRAFLENILTRNDRCFVVGFSGKPSLLMPPTDDVEACTQGLEGLQAVGWTALHDAVVSSLYYMRELRGQRALVLLSDGDDTRSGIDFDDALEYARRSGAVIYSVGLGVGVLSTGVRTKLRDLADETGGRTFFIEEAAELSAVYEEIELELRSRYLLAYNSDRSGGAPGFREVEVEVDRRGVEARTIRGYYP